MSQASTESETVADSSKQPPSTDASDNTVFENYVTQSVLGEGTFGKVYKMIFKSTGQQVALKVFKPIPNFQSLYTKEITQLKLVKGKRQFLQFFAQLDNMCGRYKAFATELCEGGDLLKYIQIKKGFTEESVRMYLHQIVSILETLQTNNLAHLDIKAENFFLDKEYNLVLGDFGMCESLSDANQIINDYRKGSPSYLLLEQLRQEPYRAAHADLFASAVTLFSIYSCLLPFKHPNSYAILFSNPNRFWESITKSSPNHEFSDNLSKDFKDLFMRMVHPHPDKRITLEQIKQHPFYLGEQALELQKAILQKTMNDINTNENQYFVQQACNRPDQEKNVLTRGVESVSIREQYEQFEYNVPNLMKKRAAKVQQESALRLSDFKTNIDCQTLLEYLFINQEVFSSELPLLSDKSFKIKCVYMPIQKEQSFVDTTADDNEAQSSFNLFEKISIELPKAAQMISASNDTSTLRFNIELKTNPKQSMTYVDFVRKQGDAFDFFEIVSKIQNLIQNFQ